MDIGVLTVALGGEPLEDALEYLSGFGTDAVELGCGGSDGDDLLPREEYLDDDGAQADLLGRAVFDTEPGEACWA